MRTRWFQNRAKHHKQSERKVLKAWVSLEARAAEKYRHSVVAKKYVKILESDGD